MGPLRHPGEMPPKTRDLSPVTRPRGTDGSQEKVHGYNADMAKRRCTDVFCLILVIAFSCYLAMLVHVNRDNSDIRRLTHGFDFRGHLCGVHDKVRGKGLTYWCQRDKKIHWDGPICVEKCPTGGQMLQCPELPAADPEETEEKQKDGSVLITTITKQKLIKSKAENTKQYHNICLPEKFGPQALLNLVAFASDKQGGITGRVIEASAYIASIAEVPHLLLMLFCVAVFCGMVWVIALRSFARLFAHAQFIVTIFALLSMGTWLLAAPLAGLVDMEVVGRYAPASAQAAIAVAAPKLQALGASAAAAADNVVGQHAAALLAKSDVLGKALEGVLPGHQVSLSVSLFGFFEMFGVYGLYLRVGVGAILELSGLAALAWYMSARKKLAVAADSVREACKIVVTMPTLALLPLVHLLLWGAATVGSCAGMVVLLSAAEVRASSAHVWGENIEGIYRSFEWTSELSGGLACWILALFWFQEIGNALCHFVLSYNSSCSYFAKGHRGGYSRLPILKGMLIGCTFHLGTLSLAAFIMAIFRIFRWFLTFLHKVANEKNGNRVVHCILGCLDCCIAMAQALVHRLCEGVYTHVAITSEPFLTASAAAAGYLTRNLELIAITSWVLRPTALFASFVYAATLGVLSRSVLSLRPDGLGALGRYLPDKIVSEWNELGSVTVASVAFGIMCFAAVRGFQLIVDGVTDAILYCLMWDGEDGVVDAEGAPESFKAFIRATQGVREKRD